MYTVDSNYVFRTVTMVIVGKVKVVGADEIEIEDACWVADTGRWNEFLSGTAPVAAEPMPDGKWYVGRAAVVDAGPWPHALLRTAIPA